MSCSGTGFRKCSFSRPRHTIATRFAASSKPRCCVTAWRVMSRCSQSSPSLWPLEAYRRSSRRRRLASASALNTLSMSCMGNDMQVNTCMSTRVAAPDCEPPLIKLRTVPDDTGRMNPFSLFGLVSARELADLKGKVAAFSSRTPMIEYDLEGNILDANDTWERATNFKVSEVRGKHHRMFVTAEERDSPEYRAFWEKLRQGEVQAAVYRRVAKAG